MRSAGSGFNKFQVIILPNWLLGVFSLGIIRTGNPFVDRSSEKINQLTLRSVQCAV